MSNRASSGRYDLRQHRPQKWVGTGSHPDPNPRTKRKRLWPAMTAANAACRQGWVWCGRSSAEEL